MGGLLQREELGGLVSMEDECLSLGLIEVFTLKIGMIQTALSGRFGHRPLNRFPLKRGENNEGNDSLNGIQACFCPNVRENGTVAGEADDQEPGRTRLKLWTLQSSQACLTQHECSTASVCSLLQSRHTCALVHTPDSSSSAATLDYGPSRPF